MTAQTLTTFLGWCSVINIAVLMIWFLGIVFARDFIYKIHTKWFKVNPESFDAIHYCGIGIFKLFVNFLNVVPYIALKIMF